MGNSTNNVFLIFSEYFWLLAIIGTSLPVCCTKKLTKYEVQQKPELAFGYKKLFWTYLLLMNVPWLIMGIGIVFGDVPYVWYFFKPREGNPYVLAWHGSVLLIIIIITYWLYFEGGAEILIKHYALFNIGTSNIAKIKLFWPLFIAGPLLAEVMMWIIDFKIPRLP